MANTTIATKLKGNEVSIIRECLIKFGLPQSRVALKKSCFMYMCSECIVDGTKQVSKSWTEYYPVKTHTHPLHPCKCTYARHVCMGTQDLQPPLSTGFFLLISP